MQPSLLIGNKNYSSWSLRGWLMLKAFQIPFEEKQVLLCEQHTTKQLLAHSPSKLVPVLTHGKLIIHDSLAICEYANEQWLSGKAWPENIHKRAQARAICAEMHSGFSNIRNKIPMNCRRKIADFQPDLATQLEIKRILEIWKQCLQASNSQWLFDSFSIADVFYAPIVSRFTSYQITLPQFAQAYCDEVLVLEPMQQWYQEAKQEKAVIEIAEV